MVMIFIVSPDTFMYSPSKPHDRLRVVPTILESFKYSPKGLKNEPSSEMMYFGSKVFERE